MNVDIDRLARRPGEASRVSLEGAARPGSSWSSAEEFRRPVYPGCDWIEARARARRDPVDQVLARLLAGRDLTSDAHLEIAFILAERWIRTDGNARPQAILQRIRAHAESVVRARPRALEARRLASTAAFLDGALDEGFSLLSACEHLSASSGSLTPASLKVDAIRILIARGHLEEAAGLIGALPENLREKEGFVVASALFERASGRAPEAKKRLEDARRRFPWSMDVELELAKSQWATGEQDAAVETFRRIRARRRRCPAAQWNLVAALCLVGRTEEAQEALFNARASVRTDATLRSLLARGRIEPSPEQSALRGDLATVSLPDLLSLLGHIRATGVLVLLSPHGRGEIFLREGKLTGAYAPRPMVRRSVPASSPMEAIIRSEGLRRASPSSSGGEPLRPESRRSSGPTSGTSEIARSEDRLLAALEQLLEWEAGTFAFERRRAGALLEMSSEVAIDTPVALLHACAGLDERRRAAP